MSPKLVSGNKILDTGSRAAVVGILNVTPDSFADGGKWLDPAVAVVRAMEMINQGADIIDIGGESTGPGSADVSAEDELARILPVISAIRSALPHAWLSLDTWKAVVAESALIAGVDMMNDISAGRFDPKMFDIIAEHRCPYVLMYSKDLSPRTTKEDRHYDNVIETITTFLIDRLQIAQQQGIDPASCVIDPGLGHFVSADPQYSFEILDHLSEFAKIASVFISPSRKSFLAGPTNLPVTDRLIPTLAATKTAIKNGASFIRTHDVGETRELIDGYMNEL